MYQNQLGEKSKACRLYQGNRGIGFSQASLQMENNYSYN